jgi:hypothetical protein
MLCVCVRARVCARACVCVCVCVEEIVVHYGNYGLSCTEQVCPTNSRVRAGWSDCYKLVAVGQLFRDRLQVKPSNTNGHDWDIPGFPHLLQAKSGIIPEIRQQPFPSIHFPIHFSLTLILLMRKIWWAPNNVSRWQMVFNLVFKGLIFLPLDAVKSCSSERRLQMNTK